MSLGRAEFGVSVSTELDVVVPCSDARLRILELLTGDVNRVIDLGCHPRSPMVMDPWNGDLWMVLQDATLIQLHNGRDLIKLVPD